MLIFVETGATCALGLIFAIEWVVRTNLIAFYRFFPFPKLLDALYKHLSFLRKAFNKGFEGPKETPELNADFRDLVLLAGYRVEEHYAETADGFCLVLHRILPPLDSNEACKTFDASELVRRSSRTRYRRHLVRSLDNVQSNRPVQRPFPVEQVSNWDITPTVSNAMGCYKMSIDHFLLNTSSPKTPFWSVRSTEAVSHSTLHDPKEASVVQKDKKLKLEAVLTTDEAADSPAKLTSNLNWAQILESASCRRRPIFMMHGLMMCSEIFVVNKKVSLAMALVDAGYDVWLGNNRGNKYSWMHRVFKRRSEKYWDFSMDELARFDIPASVGYILRVTGVPSLSYIGFSNGSAQMFASLATNEALNRVIDLFIALAPACKLQSLHPESDQFSLLYPLLSSSRTLFRMFFGKKVMLSLTPIWKSILSVKYFTKVIDLALWCLFAWHPANVKQKVREIFYCHLYSTTSTKVVHHWFQMLKSGRFEFYNDSDSDRANETVSIPQYRINRITVPVVLIYGANDKLSDVGWIMSQLQLCQAFKIPHYEHIDCLIAQDVCEKIFPVVLHVLDKRVSKFEGAQADTDTQSEFYDNDCDDDEENQQEVSKRYDDDMGTDEINCVQTRASAKGNQNEALC